MLGFELQELLKLTKAKSPLAGVPIFSCGLRVNAGQFIALASDRNAPPEGKHWSPGKC
jgi:hypothetical protein